MVARRGIWLFAVVASAPGRSRGFEIMSKKTTTGPRKSLLAGASVLAAAAALAGTPAFAQDNSSTTASSGDDEAIVVTGTRLVRQDFEAISPVTTVGSEQ